MPSFTLACEARGSLLIYVGTPSAPDDAEWDRYLELIHTVGTKWQLARIAVYADQAAAPNALQRKHARRMIAPFAHQVAVISDSTLARATATALRWLGTEIRAFSPQHSDEAWRYLAASAEESAWLVSTERRIRATLHAPARAT